MKRLKIRLKNGNVIKGFVKNSVAGASFELVEDECNDMFSVTFVLPPKEVYVRGGDVMAVEIG